MRTFLGIGHILLCFAAPVTSSIQRNVSILINWNNVKGQVGLPGVTFLGKVQTTKECEDLCYQKDNKSCLSFTFHHLGFNKPQYRGHCYGRSDNCWHPAPQNLIDSGLRHDAGRLPSSTCSIPGPPKSRSCKSDLDCSGSLGICSPSGECLCRPGWTGPTCGQIKFKPSSARKAFQSSNWTWGGSPIFDAQTGLYHIYVSSMTNLCGIMHYQTNSEIIHLTSANATGPFIYQSVALAPRNGYWDDGACHGVTVHRLKNGSLAMFYMGFEKNWKAPGHPNCTSKYDPTLGDHSGRRIGLAMGDSPFGPWKRFDAPVFGPCGDATKCWDNLDVSNPTPIIKDDGNVIFLYKGRGRRKQAIGLAFGPLEGPYVRNSTGLQSAQGLPGEDPWGWIDPSTGVIHALTHSGNGETSAGGHSYSLDGIHWKEAEMAYTGKVNWENGSFTVLERRERPQVLLSPVNNGSFGTPSILFTSAQPCAAAEDGGAVPCRSFTMLEEIDLS